MTQRTLFILQFVLVVALLTVHYYAYQHDLYWHYIWLDVPMHFLGGLWAGLAVTWGLRTIGWHVSFASVYVGVLAIGITWEIYEYIVGVQREANYAFDTGLDIVMDSLGGILGFFVARAWPRDTIKTNAEV